MNFMFMSPNMITDTADISVYEDEPLSLTSGYSFASIFDRDTDNVFTWSAGTGTNTSLHIDMHAAVVDTILLQGINFSEFEILVNSLTVAPVGADTSVSHWNGWTDNNFLMQMSAATANTIEIVVYTTTTGLDRQCAQVIIGLEQYELPHNPDFADYNPSISGQRIEKRMADGGAVTYRAGEKFAATFKLNWMDESAATDIYDLWKTVGSFVFMPYPTTSGWDGRAYEVNLVGDWEMDSPQVNDRTLPYYQGSIKIAEVPGVA